MNTHELNDCKCGGRPVKMKTPNTAVNYFHIECNVCYMGTCTDTNEFIIQYEWKMKRNNINWYKK